MKRKVTNIEQQLLQAVNDYPYSRYRLAKESGVSQAQLCQFVNGNRSLTLPAAAKLAKALGLELVKTTESKTKKR